jgi:hypothetical protein
MVLAVTGIGPLERQISGLIEPFNVKSDTHDVQIGS